MTPNNNIKPARALLLAAALLLPAAASALTSDRNQPIQIEAGAKRVRLDNARWAAMGGSLNLHNFVWEKQSGISSKGNATNLHLQELDNLIGLGKDDKSVKLQLVVAGDWDLRYSRDATGYLKLTQQSGSGPPASFTHLPDCIAE